MESQEMGGSAGRVLVVDDEPAVLEVVIEAARAFGYEADGASTARDALARLAADDEYDVVLVDVRLPDMDGTTLSRHIAGRHPGLARRILFSTGDETISDRLGPGGGHGIPCLVKPFSLEDLASALDGVRAAA